MKTHQPDQTSDWRDKVRELMSVKSKYATPILDMVKERGCCPICDFKVLYPDFPGANRGVVRHIIKNHKEVKGRVDLIIDLIQSLLDQQEQRHQREMEKRVAKLGEPLSTYIQWKGTDVCMDWYCENGHHNHIDGYSYYEVVCEFCQKEYKLGDSVSLYQISQSIKEKI